MITRNFVTASGRKVEVKGRLVEFSTPELDDDVRIEMDVVVEGFGSQGGIPTMTNFTVDGVDYVARVGNLALTQEQVSIIFEIRGQLMQARDAALAERVPYGTYEDVEHNHPWMRGTY